MAVCVSLWGQLSPPVQCTSFKGVQHSTVCKASEKSLRESQLLTGHPSWGTGSPKPGKGARPSAPGEPELSTLSLSAAEPMFWEIMRLRKEMSLAKLGFFPQEA